ncbi:MAG: hypothetical protein K2Q22_11330, partial [Cytophagales bacterium]|nr:hypothetical protein [Cytophagales bacterium]
MNQWISNRWVPLLGTVLLSLDPFFSLCLHEGRMDIMVCFLAISSFYLLQDSSNPVRFWSASVLLGIGLLTSSRAIFYFPAFVVFLLLNGDSPKDIFLWLLVASMPVLGWLVFSFNSLDHLMAYISHKNSEESLGYFFNMHWPLYVPVHLFLVLSMGLVIGLLVLYLNPSALLEKNMVFCFGVVLGYYILVVDYGPYSIFIIPYLYLILLKLGQDVGKWPVISIAMLLFFFNTAYFSLKAVQVLSSWDIRNPSFLEERIKTRIPSGSKVVGDALLYYAVERSNCKFQYIDHFGNDVGVREKILINDFDFEYLILSDQYMKRSFADAQYLIQSGRYELVEKVNYHPQTVSSSILPLWALSQLENSTGYNCTIFRRKK